jgi:hypothetical protein
MWCGRLFGRCEMEAALPADSGSVYPVEAQDHEAGIQRPMVTLDQVGTANAIDSARLHNANFLFDAVR